MAMQKASSAYLYAEKILQAKVPHYIFASEQDTLRAQFMQGRLDDELLMVIDDHPEDSPVAGLSSFI